MAVETMAEILEVLKYLQDVFTQKLEPANMQAYVKGLADVNIIKLRAGAEKVAQNNRFFPRLAELRTAADIEILPIEGFIRRREKLRYRSFDPAQNLAEEWDKLIMDCWTAGYWELAGYVEKIKSRSKATINASVKAEFIEAAL